MDEPGAPVAGNGLLDRRLFLRGSLLGGVSLLATSASGMDRSGWMKAPGAPMSEQSEPSSHEAHVKRIAIRSAPGTTGAGISSTPLQFLEGTITPSRLHFERHHSGIPEIEPDDHRLVIHGMVERPLSFSLDSLSRYPMVSRIHFLECSGNSGELLAPEPIQASCGSLHGLVSGSEWSGVPLSLLLDEVGVSPKARWLVADGADSAVMARSIPLEKAMDDALLALYQNGERLRPSNGYPMRLFLPGWEGNLSVKWLRTIRLADRPAMTREETAKYTDLQADGSARGFSFEMDVKSVITNPSPGLHLAQNGVYAISGMAWSGSGRVRRVEVSADGGRSWAEAALDEPVLPKSLTRFRIPWRWNGGEAVLLSRATDEFGGVQPTRKALLARRSPAGFYHYNAMVAWKVSPGGEVTHVYA